MCRSKCCGGTCCGMCRLGAVLSAVITRAVFCLHSLIAFWRIMATTSWSHFYWLLLTGLVGLLIETTVTLCARKGQEYKWFCPSVFFYLCTIVPCVWILELDRLEERILIRDLTERGINISELQTNGNQHINMDLLLGGIGNISLPSIHVPISMDPGQWVVMIEQLLLFVLILGRWMLPKGDISRDELSQLLLVYIGMAADIIEFFEAFKEEKVKFNWTLIMTIMAIWSSSLLQFCLVLTASKSTKARAGFVPVRDPDNDVGGCCGCCSNCCGTEVFGIVTTMVLQDGPFLALRLLLLFRYEVNSYMHIFFTVKNTLVLLLMVYRLYVLFDSRRRRRRAPQRQQAEYVHLDDVGSQRSTDPPRRKGVSPADDKEAPAVMEDAGGRRTDSLQRSGFRAESARVDGSMAV